MPFYVYFELLSHRGVIVLALHIVFICMTSSQFSVMAAITCTSLTSRRGRGLKYLLCKKKPSSHVPILTQVILPLPWNKMGLQIWNNLESNPNLEEILECELILGVIVTWYTVISFCRYYKTYWKLINDIYWI